MVTAPPTFRPPWLPHRFAKAESTRRHDERRGSARERGYDSRWEKARKAWLGKHPLCVCCWANGVAHPAAVLDHIVPHKGDKARFWDGGNWQGLCQWCDKSIKRPVENDWLARGGVVAVLHLDRKIAGWVHPAAR